MNAFFTVGWTVALAVVLVLSFVDAKRGTWGADPAADAAAARRTKPYRIVLGVVGLACMLGALLTL